MSTILNALKKLEQEHKRNKKKDVFQSNQELLDHRSLGYESWRDRLSDFKFRWAWAAIAIIGVGIGFFVAGLDSTPIQKAPASPSEKVARAEHPARPLATSPKVKPKPAAIPEKASSAPQPEEKPTPLKPFDTDAGKPKPLKARQKPGEREVPYMAANNPPKKTPPANPPRPAATQPKKKAVSPAPAKKKAVNPPDTNRFSQATRLTDGRLEVQAIAWSPVVEDRMAVINNEIVHQGNTIEGFSVVEIGEDKVLVKEGPQFYVVFFGSR